ncbi:hypothetical protein HN836_01200, partial [Candidatus Woesearchaeota archaeon]|nr:hypothetical protein [Candidatus Woesearchaeota archaeon]
MKRGIFLIFIVILLISFVNAEVLVNIKTYADDNFSDQKTVFKEGDFVYVSADNGVSCCESTIANLIYEGFPQINVDLYDNGDNFDDDEDDGFFRGRFQLGLNSNNPNNFYVNVADNKQLLIYIALTSLSTGNLNIETDYTKPTTVSLSGNLNDNNNIELNFDISTDNYGIDNYIIYRSNQVLNEQNKNNAEKFYTNANFYLDGNTVGGNTYYYGISAVDNTGNIGLISNIFEVLTEDDIAPNSVSNIYIETKKSGEIYLNWNNVSDNIGVEEYIIYKHTQPILDHDQVPEYIRTDKTNFSDINSNDGIIYYYAISAIDAFNNKGEIIESPYAIVDINPPETINDFSAEIKSGGNIDFKWSLVNDAKSYVLYYSPSSSNLFNGNKIVLNENQTSYTFNANQTNYYAIVGVDIVGNAADLSNNLYLIPDASGPNSITDLRIEVYENLLMKLLWTKSNSSDVSYYQIYRSNGGNFNLIDSTDKLYYKDEDIVNEKSYVYYIVGVDEVGNKGPISTNISAIAIDSQINLEITYPATGSTINKDITVVSGITEIGSEVEIINKVDGSTNIAFVDNSGNFLGHSNLYLGLNKIEVIARDKNKNFKNLSLLIRKKYDNSSIVNGSKSQLNNIIDEMNKKNIQLEDELSKQNSIVNKSNFLKLSDDQKNRMEYLIKGNLKYETDLIRIADGVSERLLDEFDLPFE